eukprot:m.184908 g.184908  ORF g.184908 m.184908 type:complete len:358 (-) comp18491_c1_seq5:627-1700(-)
MTIIHNLLHLLLLLATVSPRMFSGRVLANSSAPNKAPWTKATLLSTNARAKSGYPWRRVPLAAFPGVGVPQCDQRPSGLLTSKEINFLAQRYSIVSLGGSTTDPKNKTCGELRVADAARRLKHASNTVRPHFYLNNVIDYRMYCASEIFDAKPSWRLKLANGSDYQIRGLYAHDISQASVREWWASAVTNSSFVSEIDGVFADKAVTDMITFHGVSPEKNQAMFEGELKQLALAKQKLGNTKNLVFNGIRAEQLQISSGGTLAALEQADGGEFEHFAIDGFPHQCVRNDSTKDDHRTIHARTVRSWWYFHGSRLRPSRCNRMHVAECHHPCEPCGQTSGDRKIRHIPPRGLSDCSRA